MNGEVRLVLNAHSHPLCTLPESIQDAQALLDHHLPSRSSDRQQLRGPNFPLK